MTPLWLVVDVRHGGFGGLSPAEIGVSAASALESAQRPRDARVTRVARSLLGERQPCHLGSPCADSHRQMIVAAMGPFQIVAQLWVYPVAAKRLGYRRLFIRTLVLSAAFTVAAPWLSAIFTTSGLLSPDVPLASVHVGTRLAVYLSVWLVQACAMLPVIFSFTCIFVFINNSVERHHRGKLNGIAQALVAVTRVLGPLLASNVFAATASHEVDAWPLSFHLVFYILALSAILAAALALWLPESIEKQKKGAEAAKAVPEGRELDAVASPQASTAQAAAGEGQRT